MNVQVTIDFFRSISKLSKAEQKQVQETISNIAFGPERNGLRKHKIDHPSNAIISHSVNRDIRLISHYVNDVLTLLYTDHHDASYDWVKRKKFISLENTLRIISVTKEQEIVGESNIGKKLIRHPQFKDKNQILSILRSLSSDDEALDFIANLDVSDEIKDELFQYLVSKQIIEINKKHDIALFKDDKILKDALKYPLDIWRVFLHPIQKAVIDFDLNKKLVITGGPGTGKTVCLIHRLKRALSKCPEGQVIVLTTFKKILLGYVSEMLHKLNIKLNNIVITDIPNFKVLEEINPLLEYDGFFEIRDNVAWYVQNKNARRVYHFFFDEYQDYGNSQLNNLSKLIRGCGATIALDYTQAIYRPPSNAICEILDNNEKYEIAKLDYCYRLNNNIVERLKRIVTAIRVLANNAMAQSSKIEMLPLEEELISNLRPVFMGDLPEILPYNDIQDLNGKLNTRINELCKHFSTDEIVITRFLNDLYKVGSQDIDFGNEEMDDSLRKYYHFIGSLKGKEYKAGIVILNNVVCEIVNLNNTLFSNKIESDKIAGNIKTKRRYLNYLYVALSRFRDHLSIMYPSKYELVIRPLFS